MYSLFCLIEDTSSLGRDDSLDPCPFVLILFRHGAHGATGPAAARRLSPPSQASTGRPITPCDARAVARARHAKGAAALAGAAVCEARRRGSGWPARAQGGGARQPNEGKEDASVGMPRPIPCRNRATSPLTKAMAARTAQAADGVGSSSEGTETGAFDADGREGEGKTCQP